MFPVELVRSSRLGEVHVVMGYSLGGDGGD